MQKVIEKAKPAIIEHYCDGCEKLMFVEGDDKQNNNLAIQPSMVIQATFGHESDYEGIFFTKHYCTKCAEIIVNMMKICFTVERESFDCEEVENDLH